MPWWRHGQLRFCCSGSTVFLYHLGGNESDPGKNTVLFLCAEREFWPGNGSVTPVLQSCFYLQHRVQPNVSHAKQLWSSFICLHSGNESCSWVLRIMFTTETWTWRPSWRTCRWDRWLWRNFLDPSVTRECFSRVLGCILWFWHEENQLSKYHGTVLFCALTDFLFTGKDKRSWPNFNCWRITCLFSFIIELVPFVSAGTIGARWQQKRKTIAKFCVWTWEWLARFPQGNWGRSRRILCASLVSLWNAPWCTSILPVSGQLLPTQWFVLRFSVTTKEPVVLLVVTVSLFAFHCFVFRWAVVFRSSKVLPRCYRIKQNLDGKGRSAGTVCFDSTHGKLGSIFLFRKSGTTAPTNGNVHVAESFSSFRTFWCALCNTTLCEYVD